MAWDFSTEPEFQKKLDWIQQVCDEKVEPLHRVFPHAVRWPNDAVRGYVRELQQEVKDQGLWALFLDEELGGPGFGQLKLALVNEILGKYPAAPQLFGAAEEALELLGASCGPVDQPLHDDRQQALRNELGNDEYDRLLGEGRLMTLEEAVELVLDALDKESV